MTRRVLIAAAAVIVVSTVAGVFWAKGSRDVVLDGTLQWGFEGIRLLP